MENPARTTCVQVVFAVTDLSPRSHDALRTADREARTCGGRLVICHVLSPIRHALERWRRSRAPSAPDAPSWALEASRLVTEDVSRVTGRDPATFDVEVAVGWFATTIAARARARGADLIVVREPDDGRFSARLAERLIRRATCPVLVVRPPHGFQILIATDLSESALPAIAAARRSATRIDMPGTALHCVAGADPDRLEILGSPVSWLRQRAMRRLTRLARRYRLGSELSVIHGSPSDVIVNAAHGLGADLVILATHGRTGLQRLLHRSVAEAVVHRAPCSVLVVRDDGRAPQVAPR